MNYGFLINNDRCIGCHACSTACKSENEVPLGVQRTWVKSVEKGRYPDVRRSFQVTRCNHCANPPCARICPVTAMYQRHDGIVEFDMDICIGCKACLQACPYDAIYIDPESGTAAKCHYCAHRVELGLEPACVVVCPEHAILAGDLDEPNSEIARELAASRVTVRKPEQGTAPKLFYISGEDAAMHPTATSNKPATFAWADVLEAEARQRASDRAPMSATSSSKIRTPGTQGVPLGGPIVMGDARMAEQMVQLVYNAQHKIPWHWPVPAYLVTKSVGCGLFMIMTLGMIFGKFGFDTPSFLALGFLSLVFLVATTVLLVLDLEKPERFLRIVTRPQWRSWLVRGAYLLIAFSTIAGVWWVAEFLDWWGLIDIGGLDSARPVLNWVVLPLAVGSAVYTAFLFGQAEGRDLWQSTLLPFHLIVQAFLAGAAAVAGTAVFMDLDPGLLSVSMDVFMGALILDLFMILAGEFGMPHASEVAARAAHDISHGRYARSFWAGAIVAGHLIPILLLLVPSVWAGLTAGLLALIGLYIYEFAFIMAPQQIPNS